MFKKTLNAQLNKTIEQLFGESCRRTDPESIISIGVPIGKITTKEIPIFNTTECHLTVNVKLYNLSFGNEDINRCNKHKILDCVQRTKKNTTLISITMFLFGLIICKEKSDL